jgi:hypothetical protein
MPFTPEQWTSWAYTPADDATLMHMVALGRADAELWAKAKGLRQAAEHSREQLQPTSAPPSSAVTSSARLAGVGVHQHVPQSTPETGATLATLAHIAQPAPAAKSTIQPQSGRRLGRLR